MAEQDNVKFQSELLSDYQTENSPLHPTDDLVSNIVENIGVDRDNFIQYIPQTVVKNLEGFQPFTTAAGSEVISHRFAMLPDEFRRWLTPTVKVYKTFVNEDSEEITLRLLTDPNNNGVSRVDLESVDFVRLGGNPAEVDTNIDFNISLSAREINFLFKRQYPKSEEGLTSLWAKEIESKGVAWIDLIKIDPGQELETGSERVINEKNARIKVVIGYEMPIEGPISMDVDYWNAWREVILSQSEAFYLSLKKHELEFKDSGEVSLTVTCAASSEAAMLSPGADLLNDAYLKEITKRKQSVVKRLIREKRVMTTWKRLKDEGDIEELALAMRESLGEEILQLLRNTTGDIRANLTIQAIEGCLETIESQLISTQADIDNYSSWCKTRLLNQLYLTAGEVRASQAFGHFTRVLRRGLVSEARAEDNSTTAKQYSMYQRRSGVGGGGNLLSEVRGQDLGLLGDEAPELNSDSNSDTIKHYTLLGDIIEAAMEVIADSSRLGDTPKDTEFSSYTKYPNMEDHYILPFSSFPVDNIRRAQYGQLFGFVLLPQIKYNDPTDVSIKKTIFLSQLPVSLDIFRSWWINKVRNSRTLYFKDFMTSLLNDFVKNHVFSEAIYDEIDVEDVDFPSFIVNDITMPQILVSNAIGSDRTILSKQDWAVAGLRNDQQNAAYPLAPKGSVFAVQQANKPQTASSAEPRLLWGQSTRGVLESVKFNREDIPGFSEARLFSNDDGMANNMMLREKYNVNVTMLGTTMFMPGSFFRLDPEPLDLGFEDEDGSLAKSLGLGGRFCSHSIEHQIDVVGKKWETTVIGKWESFSDGTNGANNQTPSLTLTDDSCIISTINPSTIAEREEAAAAAARADVPEEDEIQWDGSM